MSVSKEIVAKAQRYLETKQYPTEKAVFKGIQKERQQVSVATLKKGDRISYTETNQTGLFLCLFRKQSSTDFCWMNHWLSFPLEESSF